MFEIIKVEPELADKVERELLSIKPQWQFMPITTNYYSKFASEEVKKNIDSINEKYGPIIDTQRFTEEFYNHGSPAYTNFGIKSFADIRRNPKSRLATKFPNTTMLITELQNIYIPKGYMVKRFMTNMQTIRPSWSMNAPHPDFHDESYITILYYVNDSDGDTFLFEGSECVHRVPPIKGTAAMYPSCMFHAGSTPIKTENRVVVNMCFGPPD